MDREVTAATMGYTYASTAATALDNGKAYLRPGQSATKTCPYSTTPETVTCPASNTADNAVHVHVTNACPAQPTCAFRFDHSTPPESCPTGKHRDYLKNGVMASSIAECCVDKKQFLAPVTFSKASVAVGSIDIGFLQGQWTELKQAFHAATKSILKSEAALRIGDGTVNCGPTVGATKCPTSHVFTGTQFEVLDTSGARRLLSTTAAGSGATLTSFVMSPTAASLTVGSFNMNSYWLFDQMWYQCRGSATGVGCLNGAEFKEAGVSFIGRALMTPSVRAYSPRIHPITGSSCTITEVPAGTGNARAEINQGADLCWGSLKTYVKVNQNATTPGTDILTCGNDLSSMWKAQNTAGMTWPDAQWTTFTKVTCGSTVESFAFIIVPEDTADLSSTMKIKSCMLESEADNMCQAGTAAANSVARCNAVFGTPADATVGLQEAQFMMASRYGNGQVTTASGTFGHGLDGSDPRGAYCGTLQAPTATISFSAQVQSQTQYAIHALANVTQAVANNASITYSASSGNPIQCDVGQMLNNNSSAIANLVGLGSNPCAPSTVLGGNVPSGTVCSTFQCAPGHDQSGNFFCKADGTWHANNPQCVASQLSSIAYNQGNLIEVRVSRPYVGQGIAAATVMPPAAQNVAFSVTPPLPSGLTLDMSTGAITGTGTGVLLNTGTASCDDVTHTVKATQTGTTIVHETAQILVINSECKQFNSSSWVVTLPERGQLAGRAVNTTTKFNSFQCDLNDRGFNSPSTYDRWTPPQAVTVYQEFSLKKNSPLLSAVNAIYGDTNENVITSMVSNAQRVVNAPGAPATRMDLARTGYPFGKQHYSRGTTPATSTKTQLAAADAFAGAPNNVAASCWNATKNNYIVNSNVTCGSPMMLRAGLEYMQAADQTKYPGFNKAVVNFAAAEVLRPYDHEAYDETDKTYSQATGRTQGSQIAVVISNKDQQISSFLGTDQVMQDVAKLFNSGDAVMYVQDVNNPANSFDLVPGAHVSYLTRDPSTDVPVENHTYDAATEYYGVKYTMSLFAGGHDVDGESTSGSVLQCMGDSVDSMLPEERKWRTNLDDAALQTQMLKRDLKKLGASNAYVQSSKARFPTLVMGSSSNGMVSMGVIDDAIHNVPGHSFTARATCKRKLMIRLRNRWQGQFSFQISSKNTQDTITLGLGASQDTVGVYFNSVLGGMSNFNGGQGGHSQSPVGHGGLPGTHASMTLSVARNNNGAAGGITNQQPNNFFSKNVVLSSTTTYMTAGAAYGAADYSLVDSASTSLALTLHGLSSTATGGFPHDVDVDTATSTTNRAISTRTRFTLQVHDMTQCQFVQNATDGTTYASSAGPSSVERTFFGEGHVDDNLNRFYVTTKAFGTNADVRLNRRTTGKGSSIIYAHDSSIGLKADELQSYLQNLRVQPTAYHTTQHCGQYRVKIVVEAFDLRTCGTMHRSNQEVVWDVYPKWRGIATELKPNPVVVWRPTSSGGNETWCNQASGSLKTSGALAHAQECVKKAVGTGTKKIDYVEVMLGTKFDPSDLPSIPMHHDVVLRPPQAEWVPKYNATTPDRQYVSDQRYVPFTSGASTSAAATSTTNKANARKVPQFMVTSLEVMDMNRLLPNVATDGSNMGAKAPHNQIWDKHRSDVRKLISYQNITDGNSYSDQIQFQVFGYRNITNSGANAIPDDVSWTMCGRGLAAYPDIPIGNTSSSGTQASACECDPTNDPNGDCRMAMSMFPSYDAFALATGLSSTDGQQCDSCANIVGTGVLSAATSAFYLDNCLSSRRAMFGAANVDATTGCPSNWSFKKIAPYLQLSYDVNTASTTQSAMAARAFLGLQLGNGLTHTASVAMKVQVHNYLSRNDEGIPAFKTQLEATTATTSGSYQSTSPVHTKFKLDRGDATGMPDATFPLHYNETATTVVEDTKTAVNNQSAIYTEYPQLFKLGLCELANDHADSQYPEHDAITGAAKLCNSHDECATGHECNFRLHNRSTNQVATHADTNRVAAMLVYITDLSTLLPGNESLTYASYAGVGAMTADQARQNVRMNVSDNVNEHIVPARSYANEYFEVVTNSDSANCGSMPNYTWAYHNDCAAAAAYQNSATGTEYMRAPGRYYDGQLIPTTGSLGSASPVPTGKSCWIANVNNANMKGFADFKKWIQNGCVQIKPKQEFTTQVAGNMAPEFAFVTWIRSGQPPHFTMPGGNIRTVVRGVTPKHKALTVTEVNHAVTKSQFYSNTDKSSAPSNSTGIQASERYSVEHSPGPTTASAVKLASRYDATMFESFISRSGVGGDDTGLSTDNQNAHYYSQDASDQLTRALGMQFEASGTFGIERLEQMNITADCKPQGASAYEKCNDVVTFRYAVGDAGVVTGEMGNSHAYKAWTAGSTHRDWDIVCSNGAAGWGSLASDATGSPALQSQSKTARSKTTPCIMNMVAPTDAQPLDWCAPHQSNVTGVCVGTGAARTTGASADRTLFMVSNHTTGLENRKWTLALNNQGHATHKYSRKLMVALARNTNPREIKLTVSVKYRTHVTDTAGVVPIQNFETKMYVRGQASTPWVSFGSAFGRADVSTVQPQTNDLVDILQSNIRKDEHSSGYLLNVTAYSGKLPMPAPYKADTDAKFECASDNKNRCRMIRESVYMVFRAPSQSSTGQFAFRLNATDRDTGADVQFKPVTQIKGLNSPTFTKYANPDYYKLEGPAPVQCSSSSSGGAANCDVMLSQYESVFEDSALSQPYVPLPATSTQQEQNDRERETDAGGILYVLKLCDIDTDDNTATCKRKYENFRFKVGADNAIDTQNGRLQVFSVGAYSENGYSASGAQSLTLSVNKLGQVSRSAMRTFRFNLMSQDQTANKAVYVSKIGDANVRPVCGAVGSNCQDTNTDYTDCGNRYAGAKGATVNQPTAALAPPNSTISDSVALLKQYQDDSVPALGIVAAATGAVDDIAIEVQRLLAEENGVFMGASQLKIRAKVTTYATINGAAAAEVSGAFSFVETASTKLVPFNQDNDMVMFQNSVAGTESLQLKLRYDTTKNIFFKNTYQRKNMSAAYVQVTLECASNIGGCKDSDFRAKTVAFMVTYSPTHQAGLWSVQAGLSDDYSITAVNSTVSRSFDAYLADAYQHALYRTRCAATCRANFGIVGFTTSVSPATAALNVFDVIGGVPANVQRQNCNNLGMRLASSDNSVVSETLGYGLTVPAQTASGTGTTCDVSTPFSATLSFVYEASNIKVQQNDGTHAGAGCQPLSCQTNVTIATSGASAYSVTDAENRPQTVSHAGGGNAPAQLAQFTSATESSVTLSQRCGWLQLDSITVPLTDHNKQRVHQRESIKFTGAVSAFSSSSSFRFDSATLHRRDMLINTVTLDSSNGAIGSFAVNAFSDTHPALANTASHVKATVKSHSIKSRALASDAVCHKASITHAMGANSIARSVTVDNAASSTKPIDSNDARVSFDVKVVQDPHAYNEKVRRHCVVVAEIELELCKQGAGAGASCVALAASDGQLNAVDKTIRVAAWSMQYHGEVEISDTGPYISAQNDTLLVPTKRKLSSGEASLASQVALLADVPQLGMWMKLGPGYHQVVMLQAYWRLAVNTTEQNLVSQVFAHTHRPGDLALYHQWQTGSATSSHTHQAMFVKDMDPNACPPIPAGATTTDCLITNSPARLSLNTHWIGNMASTCNLASTLRVSTSVDSSVADGDLKQQRFWTSSPTEHDAELGIGLWHTTQSVPASVQDITLHSSTMTASPMPSIALGGLAEVTMDYVAGTTQISIPESLPEVKWKVIVTPPSSTVGVSSFSFYIMLRLDNNDLQIGFDVSGANVAAVSVAEAVSFGADTGGTPDPRNLAMKVTMPSFTGPTEVILTLKQSAKVYSSSNTMEAEILLYSASASGEANCAVVATPKNQNHIVAVQPDEVISTSIVQDSFNFRFQVDDLKYVAGNVEITAITPADVSACRTSTTACSTFQNNGAKDGYDDQAQFESQRCFGDGLQPSFYALSFGNPMPSNKQGDFMSAPWRSNHVCRSREIPTNSPMQNFTEYSWMLATGKNTSNADARPSFDDFFGWVATGGNVKPTLDGASVADTYGLWPKYSSIVSKVEAVATGFSSAGQCARKESMKTTMSVPVTGKCYKYGTAMQALNGGISAQRTPAFTVVDDAANNQLVISGNLCASKSDAKATLLQYGLQLGGQQTPNKTLSNTDVQMGYAFGCSDFTINMNTKYTSQAASIGRDHILGVHPHMKVTFVQLKLAGQYAEGGCSAETSFYMGTVCRNWAIGQCASAAQSAMIGGTSSCTDTVSTASGFKAGHHHRNQFVRLYVEIEIVLQHDDYAVGVPHLSCDQAVINKHLRIKADGTNKAGLKITQIKSVTTDTAKKLTRVRIVVESGMVNNYNFDPEPFKIQGTFRIELLAVKLDSAGAAFAVPQNLAACATASAHAAVAYQTGEWIPFLATVNFVQTTKPQVTDAVAGPLKSMSFVVNGMGNQGVTPPARLNWWTTANKTVAPSKGEQGVAIVLGAPDRKSPFQMYLDIATQWRGQEYCKLQMAGAKASGSNGMPIGNAMVLDVVGDGSEANCPATYTTSSRGRSGHPFAKILDTGAGDICQFQKPDAPAYVAGDHGSKPSSDDMAETDPQSSRGYNKMEEWIWRWIIQMLEAHDAAVGVGYAYAFCPDPASGEFNGSPPSYVVTAASFAGFPCVGLTNLDRDSCVEDFVDVFELKQLVRGGEVLVRNLQALDSNPNGNDAAGGPFQQFTTYDASDRCIKIPGSGATAGFISYNNETCSPNTQYRFGTLRQLAVGAHKVVDVRQNGQNAAQKLACSNSLSAMPLALGFNDAANNYGAANNDIYATQSSAEYSAAAGRPNAVSFDGTFTGAAGLKNFAKTNYYHVMRLMLPSGTRSNGDSQCNKLTFGKLGSTNQIKVDSGLSGLRLHNQGTSSYVDAKHTGDGSQVYYSTQHDTCVSQGYNTGGTSGMRPACDLTVVHSLGTCTAIVSERDEGVYVSDTLKTAATQNGDSTWVVANQLREVIVPREAVMWVKDNRVAGGAKFHMLYTCSGTMPGGAGIALLTVDKLKDFKVPSSSGGSRRLLSSSASAATVEAFSDETPRSKQHHGIHPLADFSAEEKERGVAVRFRHTVTSSVVDPATGRRMLSVAQNGDDKDRGDRAGDARTKLMFPIGNAEPHPPGPTPPPTPPPVVDTTNTIKNTFTKHANSSDMVLTGMENSTTVSTFAPRPNMAGPPGPPGPVGGNGKDSCDMNSKARIYSFTYMFAMGILILALGYILMGLFVWILRIGWVHGANCWNKTNDAPIEWKWAKEGGFVFGKIGLVFLFITWIVAISVAGNNPDKWRENCTTWDSLWVWLLPLIIGFVLLLSHCGVSFETMKDVSMNGRATTAPGGVAEENTGFFKSSWGLKGAPTAAPAVRMGSIFNRPNKRAAPSQQDYPQL